MDDKIVNTSMDIILNAGDARLHCNECLNAIENEDFEKAEEELHLANQGIIKAHKVHTDVIQGEANGETIEYCALFSHAQDTLMTINSEILLTKHILGISKKLFKKS